MGEFRMFSIYHFIRREMARVFFIAAAQASAMRHGTGDRHPLSVFLAVHR
jgi:hypothetical protein